MSKTQLSAKSFLSTADTGLVFSALGTLAAVPFLFAVYAASNGQWQWGGGVACLGLTIGFLVYCAIFKIDSSELLVGEAEVSRKIGGRACMRIPWTGIKCIRERFRVSKRNESRIFVEIMPIVRLGLALRVRRSIVTSDQIEDFGDFIRIVNEKVSQYSIRVEVISDGIWRQCSELVATTPE